MPERYERYGEDECERRGRSKRKGMYQLFVPEVD